MIERPGPDRAPEDRTTMSAFNALGGTIMRTATLGRFLVGTAAAVILAAGTVAFAGQVSKEPAGTIELTLYKAGFIVGGSGGSGTLKFKGKEYPLNIGGVSLGATIGVSKAELIGEVYELKAPSDIEGTYTAGQASVAVAGGAKVAEMKNSKGVVLKVKGREIGVEFALDLSGMELKLKK
jgi:lipid-binding SYLF domain-containing protein